MATKDSNNSLASLAEASRDRGHYSGHGRSIGSAGYVDPNDQFNNADFLGRRNDTLSISPPAGGFADIGIAAAWDSREVAAKGLLNRLLKKTRPVNIDLDLGVLYELQDGRRGAIQALGDTLGNYNDAPFLALSGDERTGNKDGDDEFIHLNGVHWPKFKRILVYVYIYSGAQDWGQVRPQIHLRVAGQKPVIVTLSSSHKDLGVCAIAGIENVRNGLKITNYTEYFPGQSEMDRAFGFGINWDEGAKPVNEYE